MFLIPLKFRGKPFLGLAQLSKIFIYLFSVNIKPPRHRFGFSLAWVWQYLILHYCPPQAKAKAKAMPGRLYIHTINK